MKRAVSIITLVLAVCVLSAWAADITGTWKGKMAGRQGGPDREVTFNLKQSGETLTGTMSPFRPDGDPMAISNGKVTGDDVSFVITMDFGGNTMKMTYSGKVSGDEIKFKQTREGSERVTEFAVKKS